MLQSAVVMLSSSNDVHTRVQAQERKVGKTNMAKKNNAESGRISETYLPIEDYGIIGDLHTLALVGKNGSIDFCCIPAFDAPSVFGAILDAQKGGFFRIAPPDSPGMARTQHYVPLTNILTTSFFTVDGVGELIDFMPIQQSSSLTYQHFIIRAVHVLRGSLAFEMTCRPAFNYARDEHAVILSERGAVFLSPSLSLALSATAPLQEDGQGGVHATFTLQEDQWAYFVLETAQKQDIVPPHRSPENYQGVFNDTKRYWQNWILQCRYQGRWREMVQRSALALKLLTYAPTGAIIAAGTTSLPESLGGSRNWDYRFTWLRDSAFTLDSFLTLGFTEEAEAFAIWLKARIDEMKPGGSMQPMFTIHGGWDMPEHDLDHLEGYRGSRPVRIGNGAYTQGQLDVYGELMDAVHISTGYRGLDYEGWTKVVKILDWLGKNWQNPDEGIWEVRGGPREFVHSRFMSWVAFDRALRIARQQGLPAPVDTWTRTAADIYTQVMEKGWSEKKQSFVQYYGSDAVAASALLISLKGFTTGSDPRMLRTIDRIRKELTSGPYVYRYRTDQAADDGMAGDEGTFNICSFWLVDALALAGRLDEATQALEQMLTYANHVGLYSEEIGPTGVALGNFPQAFTHLSLISACYHLDDALNKAMRSQLAI